MVINIQNNELIRQGAKNLNISVSADEIDQEIRGLLPASSSDKADETGFEQQYQEWLDRLGLSAEEHKRLVEGNLLLNKLREHLKAEVPTIAEQVHVEAMLLGSKGEAEEVRARLEAGEDFATLAEELSRESLSKAKSGDFGWQPEGIMHPEIDKLAFHNPELEIGALSQPTWDKIVISRGGYWIIEVLEKMENQVRARGILLRIEEEAEEARARLEAGEDFATLAEELSQDYTSKTSGGRLGWLSLDGMSPEFSEVALEIELETPSQPIWSETSITRGGYWLVKVLERDEARTLDEDSREILATNSLNQWVSDQREISLVESYLDESKKSWAIMQTMIQK